MSVSHAALRRPVTTVAVVLALILLGAVSLSRLPVSLLPDVTLPVLTIRTMYEGAAASEVSRFVAEPIEEAIGATPGLTEIRSVSRNGEVTTTLRFAWGTDMPKTVLLVRERLDNARSRLPERASRPTLLTSDPGERPIAVLGLSGPGDLRSIANTARDVHSRRLEQIAGVASVAVVGDPRDEIRVDIDPDRARALGITPDDIARAIREANANAPGGTIRRGQFRYSMRALTQFTHPREVEDVPVGPARGGIRLGDIGTVTLGLADPQTITRLDGRAAVGLVIYKDAGSNTVAVTREVVKTIEELAAEFPGVQVALVASQAEFVSAALANLAQEIVLGGSLALIVILLFLRNWRTSLAIGLIVPLSVMVALVLLQALGVTINVLSLGGLALGVGLLLDNAIVVAEATGRLREEGRPLFEAAREAAEQVTSPLTAGTLTTMMVFGPIIFVEGLAAALFRDLSLSVVLAVGASLVLALTLMPVMIVGRSGGGDPVGAGRARPADNQHRSPLTLWAERVAERYEQGMAWCMKRPLRVFASAIVATAVTVYVLAELPKEILPQVDEGVIVAELTLEEGTAIEETTRNVARIEAAARELGSTGIYARVGKATDEEVLSGADLGSSATAQLIIPAPDGMSAAEFAQRLRAAVPDLAAGRLAIDLAGQSEFGSLIGREGRIVRVEVSAARMEDAARWADSARTALQRLPDLADVRDAFATTQPIVEIGLQRDRIAQQGLTPEVVANALAGGLGGVASTELRETDRRTPITVRLAGNANEDLNVALATPVRGIPVGQLVTIRETRAPIEVVRVNQRPVQVVEAVVERGGTARASRDTERALAGIALPPGVTWEITGADAERRRTMDELSLVIFLSVALVFLVLAGEFASFSTPLLVMLTVPLAGVGSILLLFLTGQSLNAVSMIGMVVMIGIADNDAVVKLAAIRRFRALGHPLEEAVMLGGRQRLRPIIMTSITTIVGVLPLLLGLGVGGELYRPLAAGVIGGSVTALLVTLFLLPTAYTVVERWKEARR
jgi:HAE1 family hydrophobic/amphiphilic exporter-1